MARMIAIGSETFALTFGALGFEMQEASHENFIEVLTKASRDRTVGFIVCGESLVAKHQSGFREVNDSSRSAILVVPDGPEPQGIGREMTRAAIERAAGVDLLSSSASQKDKADSSAKQE